MALHVYRRISSTKWRGINLHVRELLKMGSSLLVGIFEANVRATWHLYFKPDVARCYITVSLLAKRSRRPPRAFCFYFFPATAESFGVSAQIGCGVFRAP